VKKEIKIQLGSQRCLTTISDFKIIISNFSGSWFFLKPLVKKEIKIQIR
jgi:hypothetical protein